MCLPDRRTLPPWPLRALWRAALAALLLWGLTGCSHLGYYWQSVNGHVQLMRPARPIPDWLADPATPPLLKTRLQSAQALRAYAVRQLGLPDNASYHRYADLHRSAVIWNVTAAPPDALTLHTWCFPVTGCIGYRGYFDVQDARTEAAALQREGLETHVYGVPAYSTLGWLNWAEGDPLLNTFIHYPEGELARLIFHELAHQVVYLNGDTAFNESFATAVELIGVRQWLAQAASPAARQAYAQSEALRLGFRDLTRASRAAPQATWRDRRPRSWPISGVNTQRCAASGRSTRRARPATTSGWPTPTTRPSAPWPPTTPWCRASRPCTSSNECASPSRPGRSSTRRCGSWPSCPKPNACAACSRQHRYHRPAHPPHLPEIELARHPHPPRT